MVQQDTEKICRTRSVQVIECIVRLWRRGQTKWASFGRLVIVNHLAFVVVFVAEQAARLRDRL